jgi:hypothetical protein
MKSVISCCCLLALVAGSLSAAEDDSVDSQASKFRLRLMQETVSGFGIKEDDQASSAKIIINPLLRYSDPTRTEFGATALLDGGVWRLGEKGRPQALVTLEIYGKGDEDAVLAYEFLALSSKKLSLVHSQNKAVSWTSTGKPLTISSLPDAPKPASTATARLAQMRKLARRFKVTETVKAETVECRLLSQPIDRYQDGVDTVDGGIFAYANGTNPEVGVLLECTSDGWRYAVARLSSAELRVELDGHEIAHLPSGDFRFDRASSYASTSHPIKLESKE